MSDSQGGGPARRVPPEHEALFWDCCLDTLDLDHHREQVLERVLEDGTLESVRWVLRAYGDDEVRRFVLERGTRRLDPRILSFWYGYYGLGRPPCTRKPSLIDKERAWRY